MTCEKRVWVLNWREWRLFTFAHCFINFFFVTMSEWDYDEFSCTRLFLIMSYWCIFKFVCGKIWSIRNLMSHFFLLLAISYHKAYCMKHVEQCWMVCSSCCMLQWNNGNLNMHVDWTGHKFFGTWKLFPIFLIKTWWMM